jgi:hypothetical protein
VEDLGDRGFASDGLESDDRGRLGHDPAMASGPILTTITDMGGFFLTLSLARAALPYLRG